MISHSSCNFFMDWEPAESYGMDVDEKGPMVYIPFSSADCDVYMASTTVQEVHMASPILTSQPPTISEITFFLPPLEMKTKPIVFPPFNIHAVSRQALEPRVSPRKIKANPLDDSPFIYNPAVATYQVESPTMASASSHVDTSISAVHNHNHFPSNSVYRPVTPSPSKFRTTLLDDSHILMPVMPIDVPEEDGQIADTRAATPSPLIESTSSAGWSDGMAGQGDVAPSVDCIPWSDSIDEQDITPSTPRLVVAETNIPEWIEEQDVTPSTPRLVAETNTPEWIEEQDVTPSTPHPVVAETNTPEWIVDEDITPLSQYPILETTTPFYWPEITFFQEYVDWGADLIDLWSSNVDSPNFDKDDSVFRAFGGSRLEDLDWILEGFRATSVGDACIESKNASNSFETIFVPAPLHIFSPVSPYDRAVSESGLDLISFDSPHGLRHNLGSGSFELPSFKFGDVILTEFNELFQTSTPAPCKRSVIFSTKTDASTQTEELPGATYSVRPPRRYSPYVRYSPYRKLSRDLESPQPTITSSTSCGLPSPVDNVFLDCSSQAFVISEGELETRPAVRVNLKESEEDHQEMAFPGAYPIEQVVYALDEPAKLCARCFVKIAQENHFETEVPPCPTVHPSTQCGFKGLFFRIFAYFFDW